MRLTLTAEGLPYAAETATIREATIELNDRGALWATLGLDLADGFAVSLVAPVEGHHLAAILAVSGVPSWTELPGRAVIALFDSHTPDSPLRGIASVASSATYFPSDAAGWEKPDA